MPGNCMNATYLADFRVFYGIIRRGCGVTVASDRCKFQPQARDFGV